MGRASLTLALFLRVVLGRPSSDLWVRLAETLVWVSVVVGMLGSVNVVVFERARPGSWQRRVPNLLRDLVRLLLVAAAAALVYSFVWDREITGAWPRLASRRSSWALPCRSRSATFSRV